MVECSKCLTWVHLKCGGLRRTNIPDTWFCARCKKESNKKTEDNPKTSNNPSPAAASSAKGSRKRKSTNAPRRQATSASAADVEKEERLPKVNKDESNDGQGDDEQKEVKLDDLQCHDESALPPSPEPSTELAS